MKKQHRERESFSPNNREEQKTIQPSLCLNTWVEQQRKTIMQNKFLRTLVIAFTTTFVGLLPLNDTVRAMNPQSSLEREREWHAHKLIAWMKRTATVNERVNRRKSAEEYVSAIEGHLFNGTLNANVGRSYTELHKMKLTDRGGNVRRKGEVPEVAELARAICCGKTYDLPIELAKKYLIDVCDTCRGAQETYAPRGYGLLVTADPGVPATPGTPPQPRPNDRAGDGVRPGTSPTRAHTAAKAPAAPPRPTAVIPDPGTIVHTFGGFAFPPTYQAGILALVDEPGTLEIPSCEVFTDTAQSILVHDSSPEHPMKEEILLMRVMPGRDGRVKIDETRTWPYRTHGQLSIFFGREYGGSGVLVGPHHLLTAGHNVYNHTQGRWADRISLYLGLNERAAPFGESKVVRAYTFSQWINDSNRSYDMALLLLDDSVGYRIGWNGLSCLDNVGLSTARVTITGYPGDKNFNKMMTMSHGVKAVTPEELYYDIDTFGGQSGSGIWIDRGGDPCVVGVHAYGEGERPIGNSGVRLSEYKFRKVVSWIEESLTLEPSELRR